MQNVASALRPALVTLTAAAALVALVRLRHPAARREAAWLAALLAALAARLLLPRGGVADTAAAAVVLAAAGGLLLAIHHRPGTGAWVAAAGAFLVVSLAAAAGLPAAPAATEGIRAAAYGLLGAFPLALAGLLWRKTGEAVDLVLFLAGFGWAAAGAAELAFGVDARIADVLAAPLVAVIWFMLVEQGYLSRLTSPGYADRLAVHRRLSRESAVLLDDTRRALEAQDRLVAAGQLALGASHEYRNVLAALRAAAGHGLAAPDAVEKDRSLRLVLEHARAGGDTATALLERLGRDGRERPVPIPLRGLLERLARTVRPVARAAGVRVTVEAPGDLAARGRPGEVAQVLLNLARNALDGFACRGAGAAEAAVRFVARRDGRRAIVETVDTAGGVAPGQVPRLFQPGRSSTGGTGVGLYLARCLAERNGGSLSYRRVEGGSCFTLALPLAGPARRAAGGPASRPAGTAADAGRPEGPVA